MGDAEDVLPLRHLGAESYPLLHLLLLSLLVRLRIVFSTKSVASAGTEKTASQEGVVGCVPAL